MTSLKQTCSEYLIKFSENQSAPKLENRKTSPCSPCAPNLPHVLLSRIPGYHNLCSPGQYFCDILCSALFVAINYVLLDTLFDTLEDTCSISSMTPCSIPWAMLVRHIWETLYHILFENPGDSCVMSCMVPWAIGADRCNHALLWSPE